MSFSASTASTRKTARHNGKKLTATAPANPATDTDTDRWPRRSDLIAEQPAVWLPDQFDVELGAVVFDFEFHLQIDLTGDVRDNRMPSRSITTSLPDASSSAIACSRAAASSRDSVVMSFNSISFR